MAFQNSSKLITWTPDEKQNCCFTSYFPPHMAWLKVSCVCSQIWLCIFRSAHVNKPLRPLSKLWEQTNASFDALRWAKQLFFMKHRSTETIRCVSRKRCWWSQALKSETQGKNCVQIILPLKSSKGCFWCQKVFEIHLDQSHLKVNVGEGGKWKKVDSSFFRLPVWQSQSFNQRSVPSHSQKILSHPVPSHFQKSSSHPVPLSKNSRTIPLSKKKTSHPIPIPKQSSSHPIPLSKSSSHPIPFPFKFQWNGMGPSHLTALLFRLEISKHFSERFSVSARLF